MPRRYATRRPAPRPKRKVRARRRRRLPEGRITDYMVPEGRVTQHTGATGMGAAWHQMLHPQSQMNRAFRQWANKPRAQRKPSPPKPGRHEKLKHSQAKGPINKGKGHNSTRVGTIVTHPRASVPKWKMQRLTEYKHDVWQTVLLSKSARIANSNNILKTYRYPIKAPECLDSERVMSMVFTPYPSAYSGIHTTYYRHVNAAGTDLTHATAQPLDVIQNKADVQRHSLPASVESSNIDEIAYEGKQADGTIISDVLTQSTASLDNVHAYYDQLLKNIKVDLKFMASRAFPVKISVTLVRHIQPTAPYTWSTADKQQLLNNLDNKGLEYADYKIEWQTEFTLPALRLNKKPPTVDVVKDIKMNVMQTNTFNQNTVAEDMGEAATNVLGQGFSKRQEDVSDGFCSGQVYLIVKFRKSQVPQQFEYNQTVDIANIFNGAVTTSNLTLPVLSEQSFDVPPVSAIVTQDPFSESQGNESKASFYVHGTLKYNFGFREDTESIPSIIDASVQQSAKKTQSLNIDPTHPADVAYGIYSQSPSHETRAA